MDQVNLELAAPAGKQAIWVSFTLCTSWLNDDYPTHFLFLLWYTMLAIPTAATAATHAMAIPAITPAPRLWHSGTGKAHIMESR